MSIVSSWVRARAQSTYSFVCFCIQRDEHFQVMILPHVNRLPPQNDHFSSRRARTIRRIAICSLWMSFVRCHTIEFISKATTQLQIPPLVSMSRLQRIATPQAARRTKKKMNGQPITIALTETTAVRLRRTRCFCTANNNLFCSRNWPRYCDDVYTLRLCAGRWPT